MAHSISIGKFDDCCLLLFCLLVTYTRFKLRTDREGGDTSDGYYVDSPATYIVSFELIHQIASGH